MMEEEEGTKPMMEEDALNDAVQAGYREMLNHIEGVNPTVGDVIEMVKRMSAGVIAVVVDREPGFTEEGLIAEFAVDVGDLLNSRRAEADAHWPHGEPIGTA